MPRPSSLADAEIRHLILKMAAVPYDHTFAIFFEQGIDQDIDSLFEVMSHEDPCEMIPTAIEQGLMTQEQGRAYLAIAVWCGRTNGGGMNPTVERWLEEAISVIRIDLAFHLDYIPFRDQEKRKAMLSRVMERFPQFAVICQDFMVYEYLYRLAQPCEKRELGNGNADSHYAQ